MKFTVSSKLLFDSLKRISGVIQKNQYIPLLNDFLFLIEEDKITLSTTNLETSLKVEMKNETNGEGGFCVPSETLMGLLKSMPDQGVSFSVDKKFGIDITTDSGKYKIQGEAPENFPIIPSDITSVNFAVEPSVLISKVRKCLTAVSDDTLRPVLTGILFEVSDGNVEMISTDAHQLVKCNFKAETSGGSNSIIPQGALRIIEKFVMDDLDLEVSFSEKKVYIKQGEDEMSAVLVAGAFPNYKAVIPKKSPNGFSIDKGSIMDSIKRLGIFAKVSDNMVTMGLKDGTLTLKTESADFGMSGEEMLPCVNLGGNMTIAFNGKVLYGILEAIEGDDVSLKMGKPNQPALSENEDGEIMLIMPLIPVT